MSGFCEASPTPDPSRKREGGIRFAGYAAVFDAPDRGGDVIRAGAFGRVRRVPLLWQHRGEPVGVIEAIGEDARGLRVVGRVDTPQLAGLVASGAVCGLSFGYRVKAARQGRWRELREIELCEVSLVARPMQALAKIHAHCLARPDGARMQNGQTLSAQVVLSADASE